MKKILFLLSFFSAYALWSQSLRITVTGSDNRSTSKILLALTDENKNILKYDMKAVSGDSLVFSLDSLPTVRATVYLFEDRNGNYRLDTDQQGLPNEKCAFAPVEIGPGQTELHLELGLPGKRENDKPERQ